MGQTPNIKQQVDSVRTQSQVKHFAEEELRQSMMPKKQLTKYSEKISEESEASSLATDEDLKYDETFYERHLSD